MFIRFFIVVFCVLLGFCSCQSTEAEKINVSDVAVSFSLYRFDVDFYTATKDSLPKLKKNYPYLFPSEFTDSIALLKINDVDEQVLYDETQKIYKEIDDLEALFTDLFKHIKYYNPRFKSPNIVTMLSNIDYSSRVIYADSLLLVSLDVFLGKEHPFYSDYPDYIKQNNKKENVIVEAANSIIDKQVLKKLNRTFISKMIYEGKKMYLLDSYLPKVSNEYKMGCSKDKYDWLLENEIDVWKYFIEKNILFSTDSKLDKRFLDQGPFSKFYLQNDISSPGRVGAWIGLQIVTSFMQNNDVSLQKLLTLESEYIYNHSKYKPKK
ncbi:gliding motility lipoprotein GldB [uncultured Polaribacter sp.]|uniref:gliding motility lipoprotein GldB n=1 Tax=uncultured Polaribacter sp. TaxID=174711 RepID=UPI0026239DD8|nr:gliding motility lipoprotein GldB [uncultured Polaribacter sp.]